MSQLLNDEDTEKVERLLRQYPNLKRKGYVSMADDKGRMGYRPYTDATVQEHDGRNRIVRQVSATAPADPAAWGIAPLKKRTGMERAESLARRLWESVQTDPGLTPVILKELQLEFWHQGRAVSYEDIKRAAIELLKTAEAKARR